jgi:hypothetical protein
MSTNQSSRRCANSQHFASCTVVDRNFEIGLVYFVRGSKLASARQQMLLDFFFPPNGWDGRRVERSQDQDAVRTTCKLEKLLRPNGL